jgi:uncharacterized protein YbaR (Trm112 family)
MVGSQANDLFGKHLNRTTAPMHLVLTDILVCPHCGPGAGLIVLAERMENRRVLQGALGCPGCRRQFSIRDGVPDLRRESSESTTDPAATGTGPASDGLRLAALLGLADARGYALLIGAPAEDTAALAALLPQLELITVATPAASQGSASINRLLTDAVLPLRAGTVSSALLGAHAPPTMIAETMRVLSAGARLVVATALPGAEELAASSQLRVLARDAEHIVCVRQN